MKFRNPWIDPRVAQVRSAAVDAYLLRHGWTLLPEMEPTVREFEAPRGNADAPTVRVPLLEQGRDYVQRVIEVITELALAEKRYAVAVLDDILGAPDSAVNGPAVMSAKATMSTP